MDQQMNWKAHISTDPAILYGNPTIKGTRIPVDLLLEKLSEGETFEGLLAAYPRLKNEDLLAVMRFAAESIRGEVIYSFAS